MMFNLWTVLLAGLLFFINTFIMPLFGDATSQAASLNLAAMMTSNAGVLFQLIYIALGSVVNLTLFGVFIGLFFGIKITQIGLTIWMFIKSLIPFLN
jgi:hypothetical protein